MRISMRIIFVILILMMSARLSVAGDQIPRFVSLKVSEANVRTGPGTKFPIKWILVKEHIPLEVLDHFDNWFKVRDEENRVGWVHQSLISSNRFFIVSRDEAPLYKNPKYNYVLYLLEMGVRGRIKSCRDKWCEVKIEHQYGWVKKSDIWGVYVNEEI